ncbi:MAG: polymorphic toxin type 46 domain-containing protein [Byssovorax sp.]
MPPPSKTQTFDPRLMTLESRLTAALELALPKLPADMQAAFGELISPANLAITVGVLALWAASHAVGVGEIIDVGLLVYGLITLGSMALDVGKDIGEYLRLASTATSVKDLDAAATHLASAVSMLGVTLFAALIMKHAGKVAGGAKPTLKPVPSPKYFALTPEEWLYNAGARTIAPMARTGTETALRFLQGKSNFVTAGDVTGWLKGIDFSKPVSVKHCTAGETLIGYLQLKPNVVAKIKANPSKAAEIIKNLQPHEVEIGKFFTKSGTSNRQLGIADQNRIYVKFKVGGSVSALESTTAPIKDTWTVRAGGKTTSAGNTWYNGQLVGGGGTQYLIPDARYLYYTSKTFQIVDFGSKVNLH